MGAFRRRRRDPDHRPRRGLLRLGRARQRATSTGSARCSACNIGHGRADIAQAGADQAASSASSRTGPTRTRRRSSWRRRSPSSRPATSTASSSPAAAARRSSRRSSSPASSTSSPASRTRRRSSPARSPTTARRSARSRATGITALRAPFEPFTPGGCHVPNTNLVPAGAGLRRRDARRGDRRADRVRGPRDRRRGVPRAGPERRRLLLAARGLLPARARDLRRATTCCWSPTRSSARWAGSASGSAPSATTTSPTSSRRPRASPRPTRRSARSIASDRVAEPFLEGTNSFVARLHVRRPPDVPAPSRWRTSTSSSTRASSRTCARTRPRSAAMLESLRDIPIVGDVRGAGYFHALELVKDQETRAALRHGEAEQLLRGFSGPSCSRGLICRADDRGDPVVQLVAAADRRAGAVRRDRGGAAARARGGESGGC